MVYKADLKITRKFRKVYELKEKVLTSMDLECVPTDFSDLFVICDVFIIQSDLSEKFHGKNLEIIADYVDVYKPSTFDLSAKSKKSIFLESVTESNKQDSLTQENGGNFVLNCKLMENGESLTIVSNSVERNGCKGNGRRLTSFSIRKFESKGANSVISVTFRE